MRNDLVRRCRDRGVDAEALPLPQPLPREVVSGANILKPSEAQLLAARAAVRTQALVTRRRRAAASSAGSRVGRLGGHDARPVPVGGGAGKTY